MIHVDEQKMPRSDCTDRYTDLDLCSSQMIYFSTFDITCIFRFVIALLYYGLSINMENLHGDIYVNFAISACMEGIAYTVCFPAIGRVGRKNFSCICMLIGGLSLLATIFSEMYGDQCEFLHHENTPIKLCRTPVNPLLYSKTGVYRGIHYFFYFCSKHRLWVLVSRRGGSNEYPQSMF